MATKYTQKLSAPGSVLSGTDSVGTSGTGWTSSPVFALLGKVTDLNAAKDAVPKAERIRRSLHSVIYVAALVCFPMAVIPFVVTDFIGMTGLPALLAIALSCLTAATAIARGKRATLTFLNVCTTTILVCTLIFGVTAESVTAEEHGTNFGLMAVATALTAIFVLPIALATVFSGLAVCLVTVRVVMGDDLALLATKQAAPVVGYILMPMTVAICLVRRRRSLHVRPFHPLTFLRTRARRLSLPS